MRCHPPRRRREFGGDPAAGYCEHTLVVVAHHDLSSGKAPRKCKSGLARSRSQVEDNPRVSLLRSDRIHHRMPDRSKLWQRGLVEARQLLVKLGEHLAVGRVASEAAARIAQAREGQHCGTGCSREHEGETTRRALLAKCLRRVRRRPDGAKEPRERPGASWPDH